MRGKGAGRDGMYVMEEYPCTYKKAAPAVADVGWWDECEEKFPRESDDM